MTGAFAAADALATVDGTFDDAQAAVAKAAEVVASCSTVALAFFVSTYGNVCAPQRSPMSSESHCE